MGVCIDCLFERFLETRRCIHGVLFLLMAWRVWVGWRYIGHAYAHAAFLGRRKIGWSFLTKDERWG